MATITLSFNEIRANFALNRAIMGTVAPHFMSGRMPNEERTLRRLAEAGDVELKRLLEEMLEEDQKAFVTIGVNTVTIEVSEELTIAYMGKVADLVEKVAPMMGAIFNIATSIKFLLKGFENDIKALVKEAFKK